MLVAPELLQQPDNRRQRGNRVGLDCADSQLSPLLQRYKDFFIQTSVCTSGVGVKLAFVALSALTEA